MTKRHCFTLSRFHGYFEEDLGSPGEYKYTMAFWQILAARMAFIVIFEVSFFYSVKYFNAYIIYRWEKTASFES